MHRQPTFPLIAATLALVASPVVYPLSPAKACGGFFCNNNQVVNQQAERILFSKNDDGTVTAIIQILYSGPSESFAWVIPVEGEPEIGVSSNVVFQRLQAQTNPQYTLQRSVEGRCRTDDRVFAGPGPTSSPNFSQGIGDAGAAQTPDPVSVVDAGSVGPYDWVAISVDPETDDIADTAVAWLQDNGYDVDDSGRRTLTPYLMAGMNLVAFRLTKNTDAGSIRPVTITFRTERPGIPILPTAVAAEDDMGIMVWVLGEHRAIPENYLHLQLNEALLDWFNPSTAYGEIVTAAADEAGGQGFVTEQAGPTAELARVVFSEDETSYLERIDHVPSDLNFIRRALERIQGWDGVAEVIASVPWPEGVDPAALLRCLGCESDTPELQNIEGFDRGAFLRNLEENVVAPVRDAQALIDRQPYITRLYTTMSAHEMTRDPVFDFNADLQDVSNTHTAQWVIQCNPTVGIGDAPWRITLPNGTVLLGSGQSRNWPFSTSDVAMPANAVVERMSTDGDSTVLENNAREITQLVNDYNRTQPRTADPRREWDGRVEACSAGDQGPNWFLLTAMVVPFLVRRRR